jgi:glycosyltransferase involved in cell wall biosynthesis
VRAVQSPLSALRLGIFVTHPIQYFAPLWRLLAATPGLDLTVHFFSDHSVRGGVDTGFGVNVAWDVPLLDGYRHEFVSRQVDLTRPRSVGLTGARQRITHRRFDVVMIHGYTHRFEVQVVRAARAASVRTLIRGEFSDVPRMGGRARFQRLARDLYLRWFYGHVDTFCYIGEEARRHLRRLGVPQTRLFFAPYSVDTALFEAQRQAWPRAAARQALGVADDEVVLLFSGKLIPRKAPLLLLEAVRRLQRSERVVVQIVGDGELRDRVMAAGQRVLGDRLRIAGFVNQSRLGCYYGAADIFVLPSHYETWGLVVNEAMQFGLPAVVSSAVGCHRDLVLEGRTGMIFAQGNPDALAACLQRFIDDPALAPRLGAEARRHVAGYSTAATAAGVLCALGLAPSALPIDRSTQQV